MASIANSNQGIAVIGPRLIDPNGAAQISAAYFTPYRTIFYRGNETRSVQWVSGACMMIRASALRRIGLLDERYNPMFFEETEYCFRCLNNGYEVMTVPGARVVHLRRRTRKRFSSSYGIYNWCKNEMLFFLTNLSWSYLPWLTLGDLKRMARKDLLAGAFRGHLIAALRGYRDGYRLSRQGNPTPSLGSLQFNAVDS
jgi:GT2 family glycosyltransferase